MNEAKKLELAYHLYIVKQSEKVIEADKSMGITTFGETQMLYIKTKWLDIDKTQYLDMVDKLNTYDRFDGFDVFFYIKKEELDINMCKKYKETHNFWKDIPEEIKQEYEEIGKILREEAQKKTIEIEKKAKELNSKFRCSQKDCKGTVSNNICNICELVYCNDCRELLMFEGHQCDLNTIESLKFILKETKPCPKCYTRISKGEGSYPIVCFNCHCYFMWNTLELIPPRFPNPHYDELLKRVESERIEEEKNDEIRMNKLMKNFLLEKETTNKRREDEVDERREDEVDERREDEVETEIYEEDYNEEK